jgi:uncharacterized coiled-coil DUF342 family protein
MIMATMEERVGVVETKVEFLGEKIDDLKQDVKSVHDAVESISDDMDQKLDKMLDIYNVNRDTYYEKLEENKEEAKKANTKVLEKLDNLEDFKNRWVYLITGGAIVVGFVAGHLSDIVRVLGK